MADAVQPWQRPPFEPGNTLAVTHGAWSARLVGPRAERLLEAALADEGVKYLRAPAYRPALEAWAAAEARVSLITDWVDGMSTAAAASSKGGQTSPLELLRKWEASAANHRARLGLDPLSRARLGRDVTSQAVDAARLLTEARRVAEGGEE